MALWDGKPVAFCATLPYPSGSVKNSVRATRIVTLPDYQGLGIGSVLNDFVASLHKHYGYNYYIKTIHPSLGSHMERSESWEATSKNGKIRKDTNSQKNYNGWASNEVLFSRRSYCYKYIGEPSNDDKYKLLDRIRKKIEDNGFSLEF